jgi:D-arabinose 1-dehydrogenase-like Zn-dependent alcohol dehydrogenase
VVGLRPEGRLVTLGLGEGALSIDPAELIVRQACVLGAMQDRLEDLVDVLELAAAGRVRPRLETYPFSHAQRAMTRLAQGRVRYRAVLMLGD